MLRLCAISFALILSGVAVGSAKTVDPAKSVKSEKKEKKVSPEEAAFYAIGNNIIDSLQKSFKDIDIEALKRGMDDALKGKRLSPEKLKEGMKYAQELGRKERERQAAVNLKEGQEFLAKNGKKKEIKTTKSGLQYKVISEGKGKKPSDTSRVEVHYTGRLLSGKEFDSSKNRGKAATFAVNGVIPGWTEALKDMKAGEKRVLYIPANLAYGAQGRPGVPPNSVLKFDIELVRIVEETAKAPKVKG